MTPSWRRLLRRPPARGDEGSALVVVLGVAMLLTALAMTTLGYAGQSQKRAREGQDAKAAVAAAQAGIDEYVSRLTKDSSYWTQGNADAANPAFTVGRTVPGLSGGATFRYQLLSTATSVALTGRLRLASTGTSSAGAGHPSVSRTLIATLQVNGFLQYLYLSDIEVIDPSIVGSPASCGTYYYAGRSSQSGCAEIVWAGVDVVNGPLHSNDALQIDGPVRFSGTRTESSWPALIGSTSAKTWYGAQPAPLPASSPSYAPAVTLPTTNASMLDEVAPDVDGDGVTGPGCYYSGGTEIVFSGTSMQVRSPLTTRADTPKRCYDTANPGTWQTITPIPPVIYVDGSTGRCTTGDTRAFSYPMAGEAWSAGSATAVSWGTGVNYDCRRGSAYVRGTVTGGVTVSAVDDVVVTGDLTVTNIADADVIGLVAGNCVWIYHPLNASGGNLLGTPVGEVDAAILALRHSFVVEHWTDGSPLGTLTVRGSIAQEFRGPVGTGRSGTVVSGYAKNYVYDTRFANLQPPFFLQPTSTPWKVLSLVDG